MLQQSIHMLSHNGHTLQHQRMIRRFLQQNLLCCQVLLPQQCSLHHQRVVATNNSVIGKYCGLFLKVCSQGPRNDQSYSNHLLHAHLNVYQYVINVNVM